MPRFTIVRVTCRRNRAQITDAFCLDCPDISGSGARGQRKAREHTSTLGHETRYNRVSRAQGGYRARTTA